MPPDFHFLRPYWFITLLPLAWLLWRGFHAQHPARAWQSVCDPHLLPHLLIGQDQRPRRYFPLLLPALGGLLAVIALAGPVWEKLPQPVYQAEAAQVLVLDLSRSMDAGDVPPSRLERAKYKLLDILKRSREGQTALVVYAGDAHVVSPLTSDAATIASLVPSLSTDLMPLAGSAAHLALARAGELLAQANATHGRVILISDGVDSAALEQTAKLAAAGHTLSVLAVGTAQGAPIPQASGGYVKDAGGAIVMPKLDPAPLQNLSAAGNGVYTELRADDHDLNALLADTQPDAARGADTRQTGDVWREAGAWLLPPLLFLAALFYRRGGIAVFFIVFLPRPAPAWDWQSLWQRPDQQGVAALQANQPDQAASLFQSPDWRGVAEYRAGQYEQAAKTLEGLDTPLAHYNRGNALAKLGQLEQAALAYRKALEQDPQLDDARQNLETVEKLLEQQKQQQKQQEQTEKNQQPDSEQEKEQQKQDSASQQSEKEKPQDGQSQPADKKEQEQDAGAQQSEKEQEKSQDAQSQQADKKEQKQDEAVQQADKQNNGQAQPETGEKAEKTGQAMSETSETPSPQDQVMEQWLRRVPDDPGGLMRRKFMLESQKRRTQGGDEAW